jgi:hypothetical protein
MLCHTTEPQLVAKPKPAQFIGYGVVDYNLSMLLVQCLAKFFQTISRTKRRTNILRMPSRYRIHVPVSKGKQPHLSTTLLFNLLCRYSFEMNVCGTWYQCACQASQKNLRSRIRMHLCIACS